MYRRHQVRLVCFAIMTMLLLATTGYAAQANDGLINWARGASYTYSMEPNETYPDTGGQLTDGIYAAPVYNDEGWVGHLRNDFRVVTLDLGHVRAIEQIKANFLQQWSVGARYPQEVIAEVSVDGILWEEVGFETFAPHRMEMNSGITAPVTFAVHGAKARYVRITVLVDVWIFMDEIEVLG